MWIKSIILENFKNIKTGLKANRLEIDFSKRENTICLITGPNGMGKTSLLSCLTPFATLGNLDIRENNQLILDKKPGYKKIVIMNGSDEIDIEHFYSVNKDSHSVKSYFKLNGAELNPNGNVTSFKQIVNDILHIDMDYLKLIRLGDNVTNLIKLKATERKNFMSKMLPSVDNYLKYYKKVSGDVRDLNVVMSHLVDKMNKLSIEDEDKYKNKIDELEDAIIYFDKEIESLQKEIYEIEFKMTELSLPDNYSEELRKIKKKESRYKDILEKTNTTNQVVDIDDAKSKLEKYRNDLQFSIAEKSFLEKENSTILNTLDEIYKGLDEYTSQKEEEIEKSNINSLKDYLVKLLEKHKDLQSYSGLPFKATFTKQELDDFVVALKNIQKELNVTYEFGDGPIKEVIDLIDKNEDVPAYITSNILASENDEQTSSQKTYLDTLIDKYAKMKNYTPGCEKECIYKKLWDDVMSVREAKVSKIDKKRKSVEYYQIMSVVYENIQNILSQFRDLGDFIKKLPKEYIDMFKTNIVFGHIKKCELIYDEKKINNIMSIMTEYDNFISLNEEIESVKCMISDKENNSRISILKNEIKKLHNKEEETREALENNTEKLQETVDKISLLKNEIEFQEDFLGAMESYQDVYDSMNKLEKDINSYDEFHKIKIEKEHALSQYQKKKELILSEHDKMDRNLSEYKKLKKELKKCKEMYDDFVLLRSALSTKEGVPLLHIQMYLKDTKELANDLLDIVYGGDIMLDDFNISGDEFKMPYIKDGNVIPDISYASQGEQSFLNMAISFALSIQNLTEYNIPLLDEVDATFDQEKREKAIEVIEKQNEIIQSEQTFIISHNNMYDQYPVDVLDFSDFDNSIFDVKLS